MYNKNERRKNKRRRKERRKEDRKQLRDILEIYYLPKIEIIHPKLPLASLFPFPVMNKYISYLPWEKH